MAYELVGKLLKKFDTQEISATFKKRDFVVESEGQYPQQIKFELKNEKTSVIDGFNEGTKVKVHFDISGREWQGKYFVNLSSWRVEAADASTTASSNNTSSNNSYNPPKTTETTVSNNSGIDDDLPF